MYFPDQTVAFFLFVFLFLDLEFKIFFQYTSGYRFIKRPALDYFLTMIKYPNFEVVLYTSESAMSAHQLVESLDPDHCIMYKLYRDCTKYMNGHHVKVFILLLVVIYIRLFFANMCYVLMHLIRFFSFCNFL